MPADHRELLEILLAEHGDVGPHRQQQLGDDRRDAVEMAGPRLAFPALRHAGDMDRGREAGRIDVVDAGQPQQIAPGLLEHARVLALLPRIALKVARGR